MRIPDARWVLALQLEREHAGQCPAFVFHVFSRRPNRFAARILDKNKLRVPEFAQKCAGRLDFIVMRYSS